MSSIYCNDQSFVVLNEFWNINNHIYYPKYIRDYVSNIIKILLYFSDRCYNNMMLKDSDSENTISFLPYELFFKILGYCYVFELYSMITPTFKKYNTRIMKPIEFKDSTQLIECNSDLDIIIQTILCKNMNHSEYIKTGKINNISNIQYPKPFTGYDYISMLYPLCCEEYNYDIVNYEEIIITHPTKQYDICNDYTYDVNYACICDKYCIKKDIEYESFVYLNKNNYISMSKGLFASVVNTFLKFDIDLCNLSSYEITELHIIIPVILSDDIKQNLNVVKTDKLDFILFTIMYKSYALCDGSPSINWYNCGELVDKEYFSSCTYNYNNYIKTYPYYVGFD